MVKVFYAVFFVMIQGSPVYWSTQPQQIYFESEDACMEYIGPITEDILNTAIESQIQGDEQMVLQGWCVEKLVKKEVPL